MTTDQTFIVADVGGTNTRVGMTDGLAVRPETIRRYSNRDYGNLAPVLQSYLDEQQSSRPSGACVAVAGPVADGRAELTNLDWSIDEQQLSNATGASTVAILNDLQAQGHALGHMPDDAVQVVSAAPNVSGAPRLVIGVGTGFNAAPVHTTPTGRFVPACEAGHANLPIGAESDLRLRKFVSTAHDFAAVEDVLSGRGLEQVFRWVAAEAGSSANCEAAEILGRVGQDPIADETVRTFIRILGTVVGNLALVHLPKGGIYLVGGVARAMGPHLISMGFLEAFQAKGRFSGFMGGFSVSLVLDDFAALTGCAAHLRELGA